VKGGCTPLRVLYVFRERKRPLLADWQAGNQPDTLLFGFNHLAPHGIEASLYEPDYGAVGRAIARQVGRLGPDVLQIRALSRFRPHDVVFLTAGWPLLLLARRFLRRPPKLVWLNLSLETLLLDRVRSPKSEVRSHAERVSVGTGGTSSRERGLGQPAGSPVLGRLRATLMRTALARADRVVCVARSQCDSLRRALGFSDERLPVVHSVVDAGFYTPAAGSCDQGDHPDFGSRTSDFGPVPGCVLAAGRDAGRDYGTLLAAVAGLGREVRIVAGPANLAGLEIPTGAQVEYSLPPAELRERYRGAACVVVPTHGDGYPCGSDCSGTLVMLDAMACAKPVVVTCRRSIDDYLSLDPEALTVPPGDAVALRHAVEEVLASPDRARHLGAAGRLAVEERFNTQTMAGELAQVFFEVVS